MADVAQVLVPARRPLQDRHGRRSFDVALTASLLFCSVRLGVGVRPSVLMIEAGEGGSVVGGNARAADDARRESLEKILWRGGML